MAKDPKKLAEELLAILQKSGKPYAAIEWPEMYERGGWERFTEQRSSSTHAACLNLGIVAGFGRNVVSICYDSPHRG